MKRNWGEGYLVEIVLAMAVLALCLIVFAGIFSRDREAIQAKARQTQTLANFNYGYWTPMLIMRCRDGKYVRCMYMEMEQISVWNEY